MQNLFFVFCLLFAAWLPTTSHAQVNAPSAAFDAFMWQATGGGQQTISYSANGTPLVSPSSAVVSTDGGLPKVVQSGSLKNPSGNHVPVSLLSRIPAAKIASMLMGGIGGALVLETGIALYDMAKERGFSLTKTPSGVTVTKTESNATLKVQCPFPIMGVGANVNIYTTTPTVVMDTCKQAGNTQYSTNVGTYSIVTNPTQSAPTGKWSLSYPGYNYFTNLYLGWHSQTTVEQASNLAALEADIAAQSGWPSGSKVSQALVDSAAITGTKIEPDVGTVTGPATSVGKVTTTNNTTNNTTKTETVTHHHTYEGAKVTTTNSTTTVVINNADGSVVSSETKTDPAPVHENVPFCGLPGYPDCSVKVNEQGTPTAVATDTRFNSKADAVKVQQDIGLDTMKGTSDKSGFFSGWNVFWSAPAFVACTPYQLPEFKGASMGSLDPCPVVDGVRTIMAYIWALAGLFMCIGFVRESIQKG